MDARRGFVPEDEVNFSEESLKILRRASRHVSYLINEGYDKKQATTFVGNHFLLSERQRLAVMRSVAAKEQLEDRRKKQVSLQDLSGKTVWIDGFNTIITLEVMLSRSILFLCMDGTIRDLAALRGTYRLIPETKEAVWRMLRVLQDAGVEKAVILLDQPVSNSGRLKTLIAEVGEEFSCGLDIRILKDVDRELFEKENVITSDSVILDHCKSWVNLSAECLKDCDAKLTRVFEAEREKMNNSEPLEIERKFLIRFPDLDLLEKLCTRKIAITQTYLLSEEFISRRIRKTECGGTVVYRYNEKEKISDRTRIEREREISEEEYAERMKEAIPEARTISKTRYCIPSGDRCFEIDVFPEWNDRAFAEVELESEDQKFEIPDCISVIKEVTEDPRYTNRSLALHGFVYDDI